MKLAFIILAHHDADNVCRLASRLACDGDVVVVHWDKNNPLDIVGETQGKLPASIRPNVHYARRIAVQWGQWSMVEATLSSLEELEKLAEAFDYVMLLSGADYPLKPLATLKAFLSENAGQEYIECVDPARDPWVVQGLVHERYQQYHWLNWRNHPKLFSCVNSLQKKLGIKRKLPDKLEARLGSQWWALTWQTLQQILQTSRRRHIRAFFKTTWVPDELFFQTLVAGLVPQERIAGYSLTFYHFSHQGRPLVFYNDHFNFLSQQTVFFARKLSPDAMVLRDRLDDFIDQASHLQPFPQLTKNLGNYELFIAVQWRGLPGRRTVGRQLDAWYGDLEWNRRAYFVIICYQEAQVEPLRIALNSLSGIRCYGEVFHSGHIKYDIPEREHPFYPSDRPALRDMKRPNFLSDLLHANPENLVGFILRLPCGHEMEKMVVFDPQASLIFILPEDQYLTSTANLNWQNAFTNMILYDNLTEARQAGKYCLRLTTRHHLIPSEGIAQVQAYIGNLKTGFTC
jgi:hypothetical protein